MDVFIWGTGKIARQCLKDLNPDVHVCGFVESYLDITKEFSGLEVISGKEVLERSYDYIIIATVYYEEILSEFFDDTDRVVIYPLDIEKKNGMYRLEHKNGAPEGLFISDEKIIAIDKSRSYVPYISVEIEGLIFLFSSREYLMPTEMLHNDQVFSQDEMLFFDSFLKREDGLFFDIGANVGTTTVYYRKKLKPRYNYFSFEPLKQNYKCLRLNCLANDCNDVNTINAGISDVDGKKEMSVFDGSFGSSCILGIDDEDRIIENCDFFKLDSFVRSNHIITEDISALWVDTQCHEYEVIKGAEKTLQATNAPVFLEFNFQYYTKVGTYDAFCDKLGKIYGFFICYEQYSKGRLDKRPICELHGLRDELTIEHFCNILLLK